MLLCWRSGDSKCKYGDNRGNRSRSYCPDILVQVSAVQSALNGFCKVLLSNHIKTCVVEDIKNGNEETAVAELCETIKKMM